MIRVLHLSDVHVDVPFAQMPTRELLNKRLLGAANLVLRRGPHFAQARDKLATLARFAERQSVVHVLPRLPRAPGRLIPTLWTWGTGGELVCETICQAYCNHPKTGIGYCGHVKDRHVGKT